MYTEDIYATHKFSFSQQSVYLSICPALEEPKGGQNDLFYAPIGDIIFKGRIKVKSRPL